MNQGNNESGTTENRSSKSNWYIVSIRAGTHEKVCAALEKKQIPTYCPHHTYNKQTLDGSIKQINAPLFENQVFVFISEHDMDDVQQTKGVEHFYYWLNKPAIVSHQDIATIREVILLFNNISLEKTPVNPLYRKETTSILAERNHILAENKLTDKIYLPTLGFYLHATYAVPVKENSKKIVRQNNVPARERYSLRFE